MLFCSGEQLTVHIQNGGKKNNSEREERKEMGEVGVGRGARTAPAPWSLGLSVGHMNPLTCKLLVAVN